MGIVARPGTQPGSILPSACAPPFVVGFVHLWVLQQRHSVATSKLECGGVESIERTGHQLQPTPDSWSGEGLHGRTHLHPMHATISPHPPFSCHIYLSLIRVSNRLFSRYLLQLLYTRPCSLHLKGIVQIRGNRFHRFGIECRRSH